MIRLADLCYRNRWVVIGVWAIVFAVIVVFARTYPAEYRADYQTPDAEATKAFDLLDARFSSLKGDSINIVFFSDAGATTPAAKNVIGALLGKVAAFPHVASVISPFAPQGANQIAATGKTVYAVVNLDRTIDKLANLDPAQIVTPPKGFEIGYVPIATRQELDTARAGKP